MNFHENPNPSSRTHGSDMMEAATEEFELSDYLVFDDDGGFDVWDSTAVAPEKFDVPASGSDGAASENTTNNIKGKNVGMRKARGTRRLGDKRVSFRTKSEVEVMDDGFRWRKYGKKSVKNTPNPRNYYKCSSGGCSVKKRVERDRDDSSYVITTYDGVHNHQSLVYHNHMPFNICNLQYSSPSSSS